MTDQQVVGVLGGMGPAATADFYTKLVAATPARRDQDHLRVVIWSDPTVPDRSQALLGAGADPTPALRRGVEGLRRAGSTLLAVPCNSAHPFVAPLAAAAGVELVDMIEATAARFAYRWPSEDVVGLLATDGTVATGAYQRAFARRGVEVVAPGESGQREVARTIRAIKAGRTGAAELASLLRVTAELKNRGASVVVAGCTELVLVLQGENLPLPVLDPVEALAEAVVGRARG